MLYIELETYKGSLYSKKESKKKSFKKSKSSKKRKTIVIDPGHGGKDPGTSFQGKLNEKDVVLNFSKILRKKLIDDGYRVFLTREKDKFIELKKRLIVYYSIYEPSKFQQWQLHIFIHNQTS